MQELFYQAHLSGACLLPVKYPPNTTKNEKYYQKKSQ